MLSNGGTFFPQAKALGIDVDSTLSPELQRQVTYLGTVLSSFPQAEAAAKELLRVPLGRKLIERHTERIGSERVAARDAGIETHELRTLLEFEAGPDDVTSPPRCAVMADGGRYQRTTKNSDGRSHWSEDKVGLCLTLADPSTDTPPGVDPHPEVPAFLLSQPCVEELTREIGKKAADVPEVEDHPVPEDAACSDACQADVCGESDAADQTPLSPRVTSRDVVATTRDSQAFGLMLAERAWSLGLFQSDCKAYVGDGQNWIWTVWARHFKAWDFEPILDVIHAVTYVYAAAMAGRPVSEGWSDYDQWIRWLWNSEADHVIAAVRARRESLRETTDEDGDTSPHHIVRKTLTYLENQQSRMDYARYRKRGLPITSSHMESAIKELNHRIKGSEKFWSETGGESVLQLKADQLSTSQPLKAFWTTPTTTRTTTRTGLRARCRNPATA